MMSAWTIPFEITLISPWSIPSSTTGAGKSDIVQMRNENDDLIIPATLLKGNLRGALTDLAGQLETIALDGTAMSTNTAIECIFGCRSASQSSTGPATWQRANEPDRGALIFADLTCQQQPTKKENHAVRVEIDDTSGAAHDGHLVFIESPFAYGTPVDFKGEFVFFGSASKITAAQAAVLLERAAERLVAIGGMKSVGFGRVASFSVGTPTAKTAATPLAAANKLSLRYSIDRPFIVDRVHRSDNMSESSAIIPGAAIKAIIARSFENVGSAEANEDRLADLRISHAFPMREDFSPLAPLPLSLAIAGDRLVCHLDGASNILGNHRFQPDWKEGEETRVRKLLAQSTGHDLPEDLFIPPMKRSKTRTAIDTKTGGSLYTEEEGGALFSESAVVPGEFLWHGEIEGPDPNYVGEVASLLANGVPGLGRTGAIISAKIERDKVGQAKTFEPSLSIALTLKTDAYLFTGEDVRERSNEPDFVRQLYARYFAGHGLQLDNFFASQRLLGGYLGLRYPVSDAGYEPWMVTNAGSVFALTLSDDTLFDPNLLTHLPHVGPTDANWRNFPFLIENGFGACSVDVVDHAKLNAEGLPGVL